MALIRDGIDAQKAAAAGVLRNLAFNLAIAIAKADGIPPLVALVRDGTAEQKAVAAAALSNLTYSCADNHRWPLQRPVASLRSWRWCAMGPTRRKQPPPAR